jgi:GT2 family glycosyltransferase
MRRGFFTSLHTRLDSSPTATPQHIIDLGIHRLVVRAPGATDESLDRVAELCRLRSDRPQIRLQLRPADLDGAGLGSLIRFGEASGVEELELVRETNDLPLAPALAAQLLPHVEQLTSRAPWRRPLLVDGAQLLEQLRGSVSPGLRSSPDGSAAAALATHPPNPADSPASPKAHRAMSFPAERPEVSVVVPTHAGSAAWLGECLDAVARLEGPVAEVVVVVDGPAPELSSLIRRHLPAARQLRLAHNRGFAEAASAGLRSARGKLVALLNDDAVPDRQWLAAMVHAASQHPNAGFFASRVLQRDAPHLIDSAGHGLCRWGEAFDIGAGAHDGDGFDHDRWVFGAPASAAVYRRALLDDCGGFDAAMEAYLEDVDLSLRAQLLGFPCLYVAGAKVLHRGGSSYGAATGTGRDRQLAARNRIRLILRSMPAETLRSAGPAAALSIAASMAHSLLRGAAPLAATVGTLEGLGSASAALAERPVALGRRRVDEAWMRAVLRNSEERLHALGGQAGAGHWRRGRATLARTLTALVDRHERLRSRSPDSGE